MGEGAGKEVQRLTWCKKSTVLDYVIYVILDYVIYIFRKSPKFEIQLITCV